MAGSGGATIEKINLWNCLIFPRGLAGGEEGRVKVALAGCIRSSLFLAAERTLGHATHSCAQLLPLVSVLIFIKVVPIEQGSGFQACGSVAHQWVMIQFFFVVSKFVVCKRKD